MREKFTGTPEKVVNLFSFMAEEVREILASLGARTLDEIVGRTDLLMQVSRGAAHLDDLDLNPLLARADAGDRPVHCTLKGRNEVPETLDAQIIELKCKSISTWPAPSSRPFSKEATVFSGA